MFFCFFFFFLVFPLFKKYIFSVFFLFYYNFVSFYLFINNFSSSFLIWNFLCCFLKISSLVSQVFFSTIFSFIKLVFSFWQIARLQEFFSLHIVDRGLLYDASMDGWRDGWMESFTQKDHDVSLWPWMTLDDETDGLFRTVSYVLFQKGIWPERGCFKIGGYMSESVIYQDCFFDFVRTVFLNL